MQLVKIVKPHVEQSHAHNRSFCSVSDPGEKIPFSLWLIIVIGSSAVRLG